jgi:methylmalonyl-CoA/ethylmalonyl-CoA epimerase
VSDVHDQENLTSSPDLDGLGLQFHHVGFACTDLDGEAARLAILGYRAEADDFADPVQGIRGRFLVGPGPRLELLAPLPGRDVLEPWLRAGVKLYHLAYEVAEMDATIALLVGRRVRLVSGPVPAVAFDGRPIAFLMLPNLLLIELIGAPEAGK